MHVGCNQDFTNLDHFPSAYADVFQISFSLAVSEKLVTFKIKI